MKKLYLTAGKDLIMFFLATMVNTTAKSQFTTPGDIAFTGYIGGAATGIEAFSFVLLKNIPAGTVLNFTDNGWNGTALGTTEFVCTWTTGSALTAGREVTISGPAGASPMTVIISGSSIAAGAMTGTMPSFPTSGDQVFAFIGTLAAPTFIAGLQMNNNIVADCANTTIAGWDPIPPCTLNGNNSALPGTLTGGSTAVFIGESGVINSDWDDAKFNCTGTLATAAQVRAAVNNYTPGVNWITQNGTPTFTLPSGCAFLASIFPVSMVSFDGRSNTNSIGLDWKTANEANDNGYFEVQKSADGFNFSRIGQVNAQGFSYLPNNYTFTDNAPLNGANFYRLKIVSDNGMVKYSVIAKVLFGKLGRGIVITPNPVVSEFTLTTAGSDYTQLVISDRNGRAVLQQRISGNNNRVDVSKLPAGQYSVTVFGASEKTTEKLLIVH